MLNIPMTNHRVSRRKIKSAIPKSGGLISVIAERAGYAWNTVRQFINNDEELLRLVTDEEEGIDDMAESAMIVAIREHDRSAAQWWLARRRKNKFGDALDITSDGEKIGGDDDTRAEILSKLASIAAATGAGSVPVQPEPDSTGDPGA